MNNPERPVWNHAVKLITDYLKHPRKLDDLLNQLPVDLEAKAQRRCRFLVMGFIKNKLRLESSLSRLVEREPSARLKSIIFIAGAEMLAAEQASKAKIVHFAVDFTKKTCSSAESRFVNAVLRRFIDIIDSNPFQQENLSDYCSWTFSHPKWLVERWLTQFGEEATLQLLQWNQETVKNFIRIYGGTEINDSYSMAKDNLEPTSWTDFLAFSGKLSGALIKLLNSGSAIIMDPASRHPVELLAVRPWESVADLCAAPGGKSMQIIHALGDGVFAAGQGRLLVMEKEPRRRERLQENLNPWKGDNLSILCADLLDFDQAKLMECGLFQAFDAVLLDAPCSNTGVIRRRPDVRWRLQGNRDISEMAALQLALLLRASQFVKPGGRLVYSTCSIESEENAGVIDKFMAGNEPGRNFTLAAKRLSFPWIDNHDGGSAFLLRSADQS